MMLSGCYVNQLLCLVELMVKMPNSTCKAFTLKTASARCAPCTCSICGVVIIDVDVNLSPTIPLSPPHISHNAASDHILHGGSGRG